MQWVLYKVHNRALFDRQVLEGCKYRENLHIYINVSQQVFSVYLSSLNQITMITDQRPSTFYDTKIVWLQEKMDHTH